MGPRIALVRLALGVEGPAYGLVVVCAFFSRFPPFTAKGLLWDRAFAGGPKSPLSVCDICVCIYPAK